MKKTILLALLVTIVSCGKADKVSTSGEQIDPITGEVKKLPAFSYFAIYDANINTVKTTVTLRELGNNPKNGSPCVHAIGLNKAYSYFEGSFVSGTGSTITLTLKSDRENLLFYKSNKSFGLEGGLWTSFDTLGNANRTTSIEFKGNEVSVLVSCDKSP